MQKLKERSKSLAFKTLAAVEAVEQRIAGGEIGGAIAFAAQQLRGAIESLQDLYRPPGEGGGLIDDETRQLTAHLDARVRTIEEWIARPRTADENQR